MNLSKSAQTYREVEQIIREVEQVSGNLIVILNKCLRRKTALSFIVLILMLTFNELLTIAELGAWKPQFFPCNCIPWQECRYRGNAAICDKGQSPAQRASDSPSTHNSSWKSLFDMLEHAVILLSMIGSIRQENTAGGVKTRQFSREVALSVIELFPFSRRKAELSVHKKEEETWERKIKSR